MKNTPLLSGLVAVLSLVTFAACNTDGGGIQLSTSAPAPSGSPTSPVAAPFNGSWTIGSWTCGQFNLVQLQAIHGLQSFLLNIDGAQATSVATFNSGCIGTASFAVSYPTNYVDVQPTTTSCSSGCSSSECTASPASPGAPVRNYNSSLSGSTLTLTRIIPASEAGHGTYIICATGDSETITLTK